MKLLNELVQIDRLDTSYILQYVKSGHAPKLQQDDLKTGIQEQMIHLKGVQFFFGETFIRMSV